MEARPDKMIRQVRAKVVASAQVEPGLPPQAVLTQIYPMDAIMTKAGDLMH